MVRGIMILVCSCVLLTAAACDEMVAKECVGTAYNCAGFMPYCEDQDGCWTNSECSGSASSCFSMFSSFSCNQQSGCYWNTFFNSCSGSATACASSWNCESQAGCYLSTFCTGNATACEYYEDEDTCLDQQGCQWD